MPKTFCLLPQFVDKFKQALVDGKITIEKLNNLSSKDRRKLFSELMGEENAKQVNILVEKGLLLKNKEKGIVNAFQSLLGEKEWLAKKDEIAKRVKEELERKHNLLYNPKDGEPDLSALREEKILSKFKNRTSLKPEEIDEIEKLLDEDTFDKLASDIYSREYKSEISLEEAQTITDLTSDIGKLKSKIPDDALDDNKEALEWATRKKVLDKYIGNIKLQAQRETNLNILKEKGWQTKIGIAGDYVNKSVRFILENTRTIKSTLDNSFFGNQGIKALLDPATSKIWASDYAKSWDNIQRILRGKKGSSAMEVLLGKDSTKIGDEILDATDAFVMARRNYRNGMYDMSGKDGEKLDIGIKEEDIPTEFPTKIPVIGRLAEASNVSYESAAKSLRVKLADDAYEIARKGGADLSDPEVIGGINKTINMITGRANLGKFERAAGDINIAIFAAKLFKSNVRFITTLPIVGYKLLAGKAISAGEKIAAKKVLRVMAATGVILKTADVLMPGSVEWDPRSSDFGKIKIGNHRINIMPGYGSIITLLARLVTNSTKSTSTGKITKLGENFDSPDFMDTFFNFIEGKESPMISLIKQLKTGEDFMGEKKTIPQTLLEAGTPMTIETFKEIGKDESSNLFIKGLLMILALTLNVNTYANKDKNLQVVGGDKDIYKKLNKLSESSGNKIGLTNLEEIKPSQKQLTQFKESISEKEWNDAKKEYYNLLNEKINEALNGNSEDYNDAKSDAERLKVINNLDAETTKELFDNWGFKYEKQN